MFFKKNLNFDTNSVLLDLKTPCQELATLLGFNLNITWKVHILLCHVEPFVEFHSCGLSNFAEQTGEAIHANFKPTWARFKRLEEHPEHADRLLKAVMDFGGRRIRPLIFPTKNSMT